MIRHQLGFTDLESDPKRPAIKLVAKKGFMDDIRSFGHGKKVWITVENYYNKRSPSQNNVLHKYIGMIAKETGQDPKQVKSVLKNTFLKPRAWLDAQGEQMYNPDSGEVLTYIPSTTDISTIEMNDFWDKIRQWALDFLNLDLPLPEKVQKINYKDL